MDFVIQPDTRAIKELRDACDEVGKKLPAQLMRAVKDTGRAVSTGMNRGIREKLFIKKADVDESIDVKYGSPSNPSATIKLAGKRIPLKRFGARQTKRGVTYRISRVGKSRSRIPDAFGPDIDALGNHVYRRSGRDRFPLLKLFGPSLPAVFEESGLELPTIIDAGQTLNKNIQQRLAYLRAFKRGEVK